MNKHGLPDIHAVPLLRIMYRAAGEEQITQYAQPQPQNHTPGHSEIL